MARFGDTGLNAAPALRNRLSSTHRYRRSFPRWRGARQHQFRAYHSNCAPDMIYGSALGDSDLSIGNLGNGITAVMPPSSCAYAFADAGSNFADLDAIPFTSSDSGLSSIPQRKADWARAWKRISPSQAEVKKLPRTHGRRSGTTGIHPRPLRLRRRFDDQGTSSTPPSEECRCPHLRRDVQQRHLARRSSRIQSSS